MAAARHLRGRPAPDTYIAAAADLGLSPEEAAVFDDAVAGVGAGRAGRFGLVVGVDRAGHGEALVDQGADIVITDFHQMLGSAAPGSGPGR